MDKGRQLHCDVSGLWIELLKSIISMDLSAILYTNGLYIVLQVTQKYHNICTLYEQDIFNISIQTAMTSNRVSFKNIFLVKMDW